MRTPLGMHDEVLVVRVHANVLTQAEHCLAHCQHAAWAMLHPGRTWSQYGGRKQHSIEGRIHHLLALLLRLSCLLLLYLARLLLLLLLLLLTFRQHCRNCWRKHQRQ